MKTNDAGKGERRSETTIRKPKLAPTGRVGDDGGRAPRPARGESGCGCHRGAARVELELGAALGLGVHRRLRRLNRGAGRQAVWRGPVPGFAHLRRVEGALLHRFCCEEGGTGWSSTRVEQESLEASARRHDACRLLVLLVGECCVDGRWQALCIRCHVSPFAFV